MPPGKPGVVHSRRRQFEKDGIKTRKMGSLRILLAVSVLVGHSGGLFGVYFVTPTTAVQAFFVVSGFYMTLIIHEKYRRADSWIRLFWINRYLRLAPAYIAVAAATASVTLARNGNLGIYGETDAGTAVLALLSHITMIGQDIYGFLAYDTGAQVFVFMPDIVTGGLEKAGPAFRHGWSFLQIQQGWSIGVEMWFYLLAPFLVTRSLRTVAIVMALSLALRIFVYNGLGWRDAPWTFQFFPHELFSFLLGTLGYHAYVWLRANPAMTAYSKYVFGAILCFGLAYTYIGVGNTEKKWAFLFAVSIAAPYVFHLTKDWKIDRWIGELSYPVYLVHVLVLSFLGGFETWRGVICVVISVLVSIVILLAIEQPVDRWRQRLFRAAIKPATAEG